MQTIVIKYGGHALDDPQLRDAFVASLKSLLNKDMHFVIVHGGGPQINALLKALQIESKFSNGLRVTDAKTLQIVEMALCGQVNKYITRLLEQADIAAAGISGEDGKLFLAEQMNPELGRVGKIVKVNDKLPLCLLNAGFTPVIAPLALDGAGEPLNINADLAAGALAGALQADYFVLISDVPGVLAKTGELLPKLNKTAIGQLIEDGVITGGMLPKTEACLTALTQGARNALILDGRQQASLERYLLDGEALGTLIEQ